MVDVCFLFVIPNVEITPVNTPTRKISVRWFDVEMTSIGRKQLDPHIHAEVVAKQFIQKKPRQTFVLKESECTRSRIQFAISTLYWRKNRLIFVTYETFKAKAIDLSFLRNSVDKTSAL
jgi:hypothetical protein